MRNLNLEKKRCVLAIQIILSINLNNKYNKICL